LFSRKSGSEVGITPIGERLVRLARARLNLDETIWSEVDSDKEGKTGTLRIGSFGPTSSMHLLPNIVRRFRDAYPDVAIYIDEAPDPTIIRWLEEQQIDLGFVAIPKDKPALPFKTYPIAKDQLVALVHNNHKLARKKAIELNDLIDEPFIMTGAGSAELVSKALKTANVSLRNIRYRMAQLISILQTVSRGDGVTIVAELSLPSEGVFNYTKIPLKPPVERVIGIALPKRQQLQDASALVKNFVEIATTVARTGRSES
jgi:DNA-binding transcriptional LysR family regulator